LGDIVGGQDLLKEPFGKASFTMPLVYIDIGKKRESGKVCIEPAALSGTEMSQVRREQSQRGHTPKADELSSWAEK